MAMSKKPSKLGKLKMPGGDMPHSDGGDMGMGEDRMDMSSLDGDEGEGSNTDMSDAVNDGQMGETDEEAAGNGGGADKLADCDDDELMAEVQKRGLMKSMSGKSGKSDNYSDME